MYTVDLYGRVRRAHFVEGMSIRQVARMFDLHRSTVNKMLEYSVPPGYRRQQPPRLERVTHAREIAPADRLGPIARGVQDREGGTVAQRDLQGVREREIARLGQVGRMEDGTNAANHGLAQSDPLSAGEDSAPAAFEEGRLDGFLPPVSAIRRSITGPT